MNLIENRILEHSYFFSKSVVKVLRNNKFNGSKYNDRNDIIHILSIIEEYLVSSFVKTVEGFLVSFNDVVVFIQLYCANPNPTLKKMLSFRQTCRYIFYLLPSLNLTSNQSTKSDLENMDKLCKLIALNNLIQEVNQAFGIQSLLDYSCLEIRLIGYYSINYTDIFVNSLNKELSKSSGIIKREFNPDTVLTQVMHTLEDNSEMLKRILDYAQDLLFSPAAVFEVTNETLNINDHIVKGLMFNDENVNLQQAIAKPLNPQYRTRFRPLLCLKIDGVKRVFTTSCLIREAIDEICLNAFPYGTMPEEWENVPQLKELSLKIHKELTLQFEIEVAKRVQERYLAKSDISGFNHVSLKKQKVPNTNRTVGQIDVLAIDKESKIIYVIDAKCTKTKFFFQTFFNDKQAFLQYDVKLHDKVNWINSHKNVVAQFFKLPSLDDYNVVGIFVSNSLIYFGFFSNTPIIPLDKLFSYFDKKDIKAIIQS